MGVRGGARGVGGGQQWGKVQCSVKLYNEALEPLGAVDCLHCLGGGLEEGDGSRTLRNQSDATGGATGG